MQITDREPSRNVICDESMYLRVVSESVNKFVAVPPVD